MEKNVNTLKPDKSQTTELNREVTTIKPTRVPATVPPTRVSETVTPPRVMTTRAPMITQEDSGEDSRHRETVEHNNQHPSKYRYPTRVTQLSHELNQVESTASEETRHQHRLVNIHEQVKTTPQVIDNWIKENLCKLPKQMTQHKYLT